MVGVWSFDAEVATCCFLRGQLGENFPDCLPYREKHSGEIGEKGIGKGEQHKLCEKLFWYFRQRMVRKKKNQLRFLIVYLVF